MNGDHLALLLGGGDGIVSDITRNGSGGACLVLLLVSLLAVGRGLAGSRGGGLGASLAVRRCEDGREENNEEDKEEKEREEKKEEEDDEEEGETRTRRRRRRRRRRRHLGGIKGGRNDEEKGR